LAGERPGFTLTGEMVSVKPGKPWVGNDGVRREPVNVSLLVGERVIRVEFRDESSALAAVGAFDGATPKGSTVTLPVFVRAKGKDWLAVSGVNTRDGE
jgi:hypothetical protein